MAAARATAVLPIFRVKRAFLITEEFLRFPRIFTTHRHESASASREGGLLQKLIYAPDSRIKATLDSEFPTDSNEFPCPALLTSLHSAAPQKSKLVLEWKLDKLRNHDATSEHSYIQLLSLCEKIGNLPMAMLVFTSMEASGTKPATALFNSLISTSLRCGNLLTALSLFELMERSEDYKPDSSTYDAFVGEYARLKDLQAAESWISAKRAFGFPDTPQMYDSLIQCCTKLKKFLESAKYYDEMVSAGVMPNESLFNNLVKAFCKKKNFAKLKEILKFSGKSGLLLSEDSAYRIVGLFQQHGVVEEMDELLEVLGDTQSSETLSLFHSSVVMMYSERDMLEEVELSVKRMLDKGIPFSSAEAVEKAIGCYFRSKAYDRLEMFLERVKDVVKLRRSTYDLLRSGYHLAGLTQKLDAVTNDMKLAGFD